jgi:hypothetical protein
MATVGIDSATGALRIGGKLVFPILVSNPPPAGADAPSERNALAEVASAGVRLVRTGFAQWNADTIDGQITAQRQLLDAYAARGLLGWVWLGDLPNLPTQPGSQAEQILRKTVNALKGHAGLGAWKGIDEPANPFRPAKVPAAGLVRAYKLVKQLDPNHPLVIIQAPQGTVADLTPYRPAFDITGADVYPVSYPPGTHVGGSNTDISVVGDVTRKMAQAAGAKPVWMTLQIAWTGTTPGADRPDVVPRFPSLPEERFMAYQAIVNGARGLNFFGGHLTQVTSPDDAPLGWNWHFYTRVLRPLLSELASADLAPALVSPNAQAHVTASAQDVELVARRAPQDLYVIAVRRGGSTSRVTFAGLPDRRDGSPLTTGRVLFEYVQRPLPPPIGAGSQVFRPVAVSGGAFRDWLGPHDARVYRFAL